MGAAKGVGQSDLSGLVGAANGVRAVILIRVGGGCKGGEGSQTYQGWWGLQRG